MKRAECVMIETSAFREPSLLEYSTSNMVVKIGESVGHESLHSLSTPARILLYPTNNTGYYSNPILASSAIPQSDSLALGSLSSSLVILKLLPVPLLLKSAGLLLRPKLLVEDPSLLLVLSALDLALLMLALSVNSGNGSIINCVETGVTCAPGLVSRVGVGDGVISVDGETSTSSASRYHFRRRV